MNSYFNFRIRKRYARALDKIKHGHLWLHLHKAEQSVFENDPVAQRADQLDRRFIQNRDKAFALRVKDGQVNHADQAEVCQEFEPKFQVLGAILDCAAVRAARTVARARASVIHPH